MTGTGTSTDPYQITTVAELRQYIAIQGAYLKLMNDIDFNNDTVLWGWEPLYAACAELDGNGKKITNCYCYQKSFIILSCSNYTSVTIKNTIIEAIYFTDINQSVSSTSKNYGFVFPYNYNTGNSIVNIYFYDCDFRVKLYVEADGSRFIYSRCSTNEGLVYLRRCIFNLDVYPNSHQKIVLFNRGGINGNRYAEVNSCEIKVNLHLANSLFTGKYVFYDDTSTSSSQRYVLCISDQNSARDSEPNLNNCAVFINIDGINENLPDKLCIMLNAYKGMSNCYFILNDVKGNYLQTKSIIFENYGENSSITSCFMNDKVTFKTSRDKGLENDPNMHMLSDAECKNLQSLLDIGFLVV